MKRSASITSTALATRKHAAGLAALMMSIPLAAAVLYLAKSALGINLFAGPSPLHDLLYHLVR